MEILLDIIIIGAGVSGSAIARELSRYKANILVLEKEEDVFEEKKAHWRDKYARAREILLSE